MLMTGDIFQFNEIHFLIHYGKKILCITLYKKKIIL
jgi:hypothetical protein